MCGASAHVSLTPCLLSRRSTLWLPPNSAEVLSPSCHSFVTNSTLPWSHDAQIHAIHGIEEET